jgi:hypothetical protein
VGRQFSRRAGLTSPAFFEGAAPCYFSFGLRSVERAAAAHWARSQQLTPSKSFTASRSACAFSSCSPVRACVRNLIRFRQNLSIFCSTPPCLRPGGFRTLLPSATALARATTASTNSVLAGRPLRAWVGRAQKVAQRCLLLLPSPISPVVGLHSCMCVRSTQLVRACFRAKFCQVLS